MSAPTQLFDFVNDLQKRISGDLRTDEMSRILYSTDASIYQVMPHGVLIPKTTDDVQAAVELAAKYHVPILARTAGSSLAGQAVNAALVIDFTRHLDQILEVNVAEQWARVQPGVVFDQMNAQLRQKGLQFGPDPASGNRAGLGGIVSNNSTGSHSIKYGMTADHVLGANVVLNDGSMASLDPLSPNQLDSKLKQNGRFSQILSQLTQLTQNPTNQDIIRSHTPCHWRRCGGYNLDRLIDGNGRISYYQQPDPRFNAAKLFCGAEGTLGMLTDITLNLVPVPKMTGLAIVAFDDLHAALTAVSTILETDPSAVELLDNRQLMLCRNVPTYARMLSTFIDGNPFCLLITEFYGESEAELRHKIDQMEQHIKQQGVNSTGVVSLLDPKRQANVWQVRKGGLGLLMSMKGDYKPLPFIEDSAVPVEHLDEYVTKLEQFCGDLGTEMAYYAHASAGCLHIRPIIDAKKAAEVAKLPQIAEFAVELLRGCGGAWSSEHGDGRSRSWLNEAFFGPNLYGLYQQVKQIFDPDNIFNPGNIVNARPMTENLRYGDSYEVIPLTPKLSFHADQGFDRAVEMCNGAGVCRKTNGGAMCPSFMATREEMHSTRGRANVLRSVLDGRLPTTDLTSPRLYEAMELCVSCKACKSECPSSVDMARIKTEFLAHYYDTNGLPLRNRLFAAIGSLSKLSSGPLAPLANWGLQNGLLRQLLHRLFGISLQRTLPAFARVPFTAWMKNRHIVGAVRESPLRQVVLAADTYHTYNYPEVAIAATEVLKAGGFQVTIAPVTEYGRPAFSKGMVDQARAAAQKVLDAFAPYVAKELPIIFLEPSDLSMLIDDYEVLLPDDNRLSNTANLCTSFEQFIAQQAEAGTLNLTFKDEKRHIVLHGHCHQKALIGTAPAHRILTLPPNYTVEELDTSCCGMAGSFGYEDEHYEISRQMAELKLWPGVRDADAETLIVAAGVSCRQQIKHGTKRQALHPAEVLRMALVEQD